MSGLAVRGMGARVEQTIRPANTGCRNSRRTRPPPDATGFAAAAESSAASTAPLVALDLEDVDPLHPSGRAWIIGDAPAFALLMGTDEILTHFESRAAPRHRSYNSNSSRDEGVPERARDGVRLWRAFAKKPRARSVITPRNGRRLILKAVTLRVYAGHNEHDQCPSEAPVYGCWILHILLWGR